MKPVISVSQLDQSASYSYRDYLSWQFNEVVELIRGKIMKMSPAPLTQHQVVVLNIAAAMKQFLRRKPCQVFVAPFDVRLTRRSDSSDNEITTVVQPDICLVCDPAKIDRKGCLGVPDMIVEVLSPGGTDRDIKVKFNLYQEFGVTEYWIVIPGEQNVVVYLLQDGKYVADDEYSQPGEIPVRSLPGFSIEWAEVFF